MRALGFISYFILKKHLTFFFCQTIDEKKSRKGAISTKNASLYTNRLASSSPIDEDSNILASINLTGELDDVGIDSQAPVTQEQEQATNADPSPIHGRRRVPLADTEKSTKSRDF